MTSNTQTALPCLAAAASHPDMLQSFWESKLAWTASTVYCSSTSTQNQRRHNLAAKDNTIKIQPGLRLFTATLTTQRQQLPNRLNLSYASTFATPAKTLAKLVFSAKRSTLQHSNNTNHPDVCL
jgi:hypothetical protein